MSISKGMNITAYIVISTTAVVVVQGSDTESRWEAFKKEFGMFGQVGSQTDRQIDILLRRFKIPQWDTHLIVINFYCISFGHCASIR